MKKIIKIILVLIISISFSACQSPEAKKIVYETDYEKADKLEIVKFHSNYQCYSCIYIGDKSEEIIKENFAQELEDGTLIFKKINIDLDENKDIVNEFKARSSSMYFKVYRGEDSKISEDAYVWMLVGQDQKLKTHLIDKINKILK